MYIVAIAWLYVVLLVSFLQSSVFRGIATFLFAGLFPLAVVLYLAGGPQRGRNRRRIAQEQSQEDDKTEKNVEDKSEDNSKSVELLPKPNARLESPDDPQNVHPVDTKKNSQGL